MTRVKAYSGFAKAKNGNKLAFGVIINNFNCSTKSVEKKLEKLMVALVDYL
jgi:D-alanyl-D-alanine carboxypeptidase/D-alanyl-D-alanine-endopeptidase (penicillin-binding protein 4)